MSRDFTEVIAEMIVDQGENWLAAEDFKDRSDEHDAVVVTDSPRHCYRLVFRDGQWLTLESEMTTSEMSEFFSAFGSHWAIVLNSHVETNTGLIPIRAFIKNGRRRTTGFSISIDVAKTAELKAA